MSGDRTGMLSSGDPAVRRRLCAVVRPCYKRAAAIDDGARARASRGFGRQVRRLRPPRRGPIAKLLYLCRAERIWVAAFAKRGMGPGRCTP